MLGMSFAVDYEEFGEVKTQELKVLPICVHVSRVVAQVLRLLKSELNRFISRSHSLAASTLRSQMPTSSNTSSMWRCRFARFGCIPGRPARRCSSCH